jgi:uncharacterized damage-inducible protein DinB
MLTSEILIESNLYLLRQGHALVRQLRDEWFGQAGPHVGGSSAGSHLRHCLDFYSGFLDGLETGVIDYDARRRDSRLEHDRAYALQQIERIIAKLNACRQVPAQKAVKVKLDSGNDPNAALEVSDSTIRRELQFLSSHTVHHYALIAVILRLHGFQTSADFGVAPSTLKYRQGLQEWQENLIDSQS